MFFKDGFLFVLYASEFCLQACTCTVWVSGAHGSQKRTLDPLELALQTAVSHYMGALNNWVVCKNSK